MRARLLRGSFNFPLIATGLAMVLALPACVELNEVAIPALQVAPSLQIPDTIIGTVGTPIDVYSPQNTGGKIAQCTVVPSLPDDTGLVFNSSTCSISGTPTRAIAPTVYTLTATNEWGTETQTFTARVLGPAQSIAFEVAPSGSVSAGAAFTIQPVLKVMDTVGNGLSLIDVTLLPFIDAQCSNAFAGTGSIQNGSLTTDASGLATFTNAFYTKAEPIYVKAVAGSLSVCSPSSISVAAGTFSRLVFSQTPSTSGDADSVLAQQPHVSLTDDYENIVSSASGTITLRGYSDSTCQTEVTSSILAASNPVVAASGTAAFSAVRIIRPAVIRLGASDGSLSVCSGPIAISAGAVTTVDFTVQPSATAVAATDFVQQPTVRVRDAQSNLMTTSSANVTLKGYSDTACAVEVASGISAAVNPLTVTNGLAAFSQVKVLKTSVIRIGATAGGVLACSDAVAITPGPADQAVELYLQTAPGGYLSSGNVFPIQPVVKIRDAYENAVNSSATVTAEAYSDVACSTSAGLTGVLSNTSIAASGGIATFASLSYSAAETIYLKYSTSSFSICSASPLVIASSAASSSGSLVKASATYAPSDGSAVVTVVVVPKSGAGALLGTGKVVEVNITSGTATLSGASACRTPAATCTKAVDAGGGQYTITATSSSTGPVVFAATIVEAGGDLPFTQTATVDFDDGYFSGSNGAKFTATGTVTSSHASGKNLYITAGTITFDNTTVGQTFGDIFISGGTVVHTAGTSGAYYQLNFTANSLNIQGSASIDASSRGYPSGYSYGANGVPSTALQSSNNAGASHGGLGGQLNTGGGVGAIYDNYKNPLYPGAGSGNAGGGVIRISTGSSGVCALHGSSSIKADGGTGAAGGSVYLNCGYFSSAPAWSGVIGARGGAPVNWCGYQPTAGGGGRIALISQSSTSEGAWGNGLTFPTSSSTLTSFKGKVLAAGGAGGSSCGVNFGNGSAGTIFVKHSGLTYGDLIVHNTGITSTADGGATPLPAITGTISAVSGSTATVSVSTTLSPVLGASNYTNYFAGMTLRPSLSYDNSTTTDWSDDNILTVSTNTNTSFVMTSAISGLSATPNTTFRTVHLLDHLDISGGSTLLTAGDIYLTSGLVGSSATDLVFSAGAFAYTGNSGVIGANSGITFPGFTGAINYALASGTYTVPGNITAASFGLSGGASVTVAGSLTSESSVTVAGTGSSLTTTGTITATSVAVSGTSTLTAPTLAISGNIDITSTSSSALTANTISAVDFNVTGGTVKHYATTSTAMYALNMTLSGNLNLNASSNIDVSGRGYLSGYSYGANGVPSTALQSANNSGGSHGGSGGQLNSGGSVGATYGDFKNPIYPGAGAQNAGGGVVRITTGSTGVCTFNGTGGTSSNIKADGGTGGAGGSINLNCGSFATASSWSGVIAARGGAPVNTCGYAPTSGGGGRIALFTQAGTGASAWGNSLAYPVDSTTLTNIKARLLVSGGAGTSSCGVTYGNGGAGTVYLKHLGLVYGDLIVSNNGITEITGGGATPLPAITGTISAVSGSTATVSVSTTLSPALGASNYTNYFSGMTLRPSLSYDNSTTADWSDDNILTVSTNTNTSFVMTSAISGLSATPNTTFRTIFVLDHLDIAAGALLSTAGDIYLVSGQIGSGSSDFTLASGGFSYGGNSGVIGANSGITFPGFSGTIAYALASGTYAFPANLSATSFAISGGAVITVAGTVTSSSGVTISGTGSSLTTTGAITAASVTVSGTSTLTAPTLAISGNVDITSTSSSALTANTISAVDFNVTGGTVKHYATTSAAMYALNMTLSGNLNLNASSNINVSGLGYPSGYSYGTNGTPSSALASGSNAGASHGGSGGQVNSGGGAGATYDDLKNPSYPGAGAQNAGGGVVRITTGSAGVCTFNGTGGTSANIKADGAAGGAGGSIYLNCGTFETVASWAGVIAARGGGPSNWCGYQPTSGGGGRIALFTQAGTGASAWGVNSLAYPADSAALTSFKSKVLATGGSGGSSCGVTFGSGGAGTIYLKHSGLNYGDAIISNTGITQTAGIGTTILVSTTVNQNNVTGGTPDFSSYTSAAIAKITASSTPLPSRTNLFVGALLHVFGLADSANPFDVSHVPATVTANDTNNFTFSGSPLSGRSVASDTYRFVLQLDHLDVGGNAALTMTGADLMLVNCDLHSTPSTTFDVPAGSSVTGNSFASSSCLDAAVTTKASTVNFTNYYLQ